MSDLQALDPRTPILVGVGTAHRAGGTVPDGDTAARDQLEPLDLMVQAAADALRDAGAAGLAARIGSVAVPVGNWSYADPARAVADRLGAASARTVRVEIGVPQQTPVRVAHERIRAGELDAALVVGGEAKATQLRRARAGREPLETDQGDLEPDERWEPKGELMAPAEIEAGIWQPVEQYACIDNALRAAEGRSIDQQLDEIAELWARFNAVAATFPAAAFPEQLDRSFLRVPGPGNRPLAFPYAKWHSTQWAVDQAAALVLCSVGLARELDIPVDRWVFPHVLVESSDSVSLSRRAALHRWPAMAVIGEAAADHLGTALADMDHIELYSCFPAAVRVQQRELGLPLDGTPTVMGGMAFAGGPFNNFSYQATAEIVRRVRAEPGTRGMVTTVSGLLTKPAIAVWSTEPDPSPLVADVADRAAAATEVVDSVSTHEGPATIATCTVTYDGERASSAFVIADLDGSTRWVGRSTDPVLLARATVDELIGAPVVVHGDHCTLA
jgi:acetyl-CoA C-acetyltransferase